MNREATCVFINFSFCFLKILKIFLRFSSLSMILSFYSTIVDYSRTFFLLFELNHTTHHTNVFTTELIFFTMENDFYQKVLFTKNFTLIDIIVFPLSTKYFYEMIQLCYIISKKERICTILRIISLNNN